MNCVFFFQTFIVYFPNESQYRYSVEIYSSHNKKIKSNQFNFDGFLQFPLLYYGKIETIDVSCYQDIKKAFEQKKYRKLAFV